MRDVDVRKEAIKELGLCKKCVNVLTREELEKLMHIGTVKACHDADFHGIDVLEMEDKIGFEGCYMDDLNHPDPRPAHRIWVKRIEAEKLFKLFNDAKDEEGVKK